MILAGHDPSTRLDDADLLGPETLQAVQAALDRLRRAATLRAHLEALLAWLEERYPSTFNARAPNSG